MRRPHSDLVNQARFQSAAAVELGTKVSHYQSTYSHLSRVLYRDDLDIPDQFRRVAAVACGGAFVLQLTLQGRLDD